jgi:hypothetical protein
MAKRASLLLVLVAALGTGAAGERNTASVRVDPTGLVAHEWGTFTSVAGPTGTAVDWLPLGGAADLPCFVDRFNNLRLIKVGLGLRRAITYQEAPRAVRGKIRMETPVIYFYSPADTSVNVQVTFPHGLMTEWYPRATVAQPDLAPATLSLMDVTSRISWRGVKVLPRSSEDYPVEPGASHYYAARETDAAPLVVDGQREKFLFYRGVASFNVPISATATADGGVRVTNLGADELRGVILFQNRGGRLGFRVHGALRGEATIAAPASGANVAAVRRELERVLTESGLYPKEARAMVATWRDSWFEEGTRLFYVLSEKDVDARLPLAIDPAPQRVARVFVGRTEVLTPAVLAEVRAAFAARDNATLERHGRFLGAITERLIAGGMPAAESKMISEMTDAAFSKYLDSFASCGTRQ